MALVSAYRLRAESPQSMGANRMNVGIHREISREAPLLKTGIIDISGWGYDQHGKGMAVEFCEIAHIFQIFNCPIHEAAGFFFIDEKIIKSTIVVISGKGFMRFNAHKLRARGKHEFSLTGIRIDFIEILNVFRRDDTGYQYR